MGTRAELYLTIEAVEDAHERLAALLTRLRPSSLMILPPPGHALDARAAIPLVELAQFHGIAALIWNDARLARTLKADGVHLSVRLDMRQAYDEAREILGGRFIVGCEAGPMRHDAMELGEAGADYIAFGLARDTDRATALAQRRELVGWWGEIFEVPCVALDVAAADEAAELADLGADFIGAAIPSGGTLADVQDDLLAIQAALAAPVAAPADVR